MRQRLDKGRDNMKKTIDGGKTFDLGYDGDFTAYSVEFEPGGNTARFFGSGKRTLFVIADQDLDEENILSAGWDEYYFE
jgi:hypothetical protein